MSCVELPWDFGSKLRGDTSGGLRECKGVVSYLPFGRGVLLPKGKKWLSPSPHLLSIFFPPL
jgi:hypothetical protein